MGVIMMRRDRERERYAQIDHDEKGGERNKKPCQLSNHENVELGKIMATNSTGMMKLQSVTVFVIHVIIINNWCF